jgi:hypothetical protein
VIDPAVAVAVELRQRLGGLGDLVGVEFVVVIHVERSAERIAHDGRRRTFAARGRLGADERAAGGHEHEAADREADSHDASPGRKANGHGRP